MASFVTTLGDRTELGDEREAQVENGAEPLELRPLIRLVS